MPATYAELWRFLMAASGPRTTLALGVLGVAYLAVSGFHWLYLLLILLIVGLRSIVEWFFHRYVWHARPLRIGNRRFQNPVAVMHGRHHKDPFDVTGLLFGGRGVLVVHIVIVAGANWLLGDLGIAVSLATGFLVILFIHEWFHVLCHSQMVPRSKLLARIVDNHRVHHYENPRVCFGVSSLLADTLFGTGQPDAGEGRPHGHP